MLFRYFVHNSYLYYILGYRTDKLHHISIITNYYDKSDIDKLLLTEKTVYSNAYFDFAFERCGNNKVLRMGCNAKKALSPGTSYTMLSNIPSKYLPKYYSMGTTEMINNVGYTAYITVGLDGTFKIKFSHPIEVGSSVVFNISYI